jgi:hypothetical protein
VAAIQQLAGSAVRVVSAFRTYPRNISMSSIIANSAAAEALTSVLITINRRYKIAGAGIRITGVPKA